MPTVSPQPDTPAWREPSPCCAPMSSVLSDSSAAPPSLRLIAPTLKCPRLGPCTSVKLGGFHHQPSCFFPHPQGVPRFSNADTPVIKLKFGRRCGRLVDGSGLEN